MADATQASPMTTIINKNKIITVSYTLPKSPWKEKKQHATISFGLLHHQIYPDRRGHDCVVVGFTTTNAIGAYHH